VFLTRSRAPHDDYRVIPTDAAARSHSLTGSAVLWDAVASGRRYARDRSVGFNDLTWLAQGDTSQRQMHVIERVRRVGNTLRYQATVIDPEVLVEAAGDERARAGLNTNKNAVIPEQNPCEEYDWGISWAASATEAGISRDPGSGSIRK